MTLCNLMIRLEISKKGLRHYDVAKALGVAPETFSRWLSQELPKDKTDKILDVIRDMK